MNDDLDLLITKSDEGYIIDVRKVDTTDGVINSLTIWEDDYTDEE